MNFACIINVVKFPINKNKHMTPIKLSLLKNSILIFPNLTLSLIKGIPKPINKFANFFIFLIKASITPIKQNKDKNKDILKLSKEAKNPVVVVPIFAPIIIAEA